MRFETQVNKTFLHNEEDKEEKSLAKLSTINKPISPKRKLQPDELFFINTDYLRKLLSLQSKLVDTAEAVSVNSIQKYMCQHKRLNPLAVNKFKLVRREGVEFIQSVLAMDLADMGVLEAGSMATTKCRLCVVNCFEYLRCKERIKSDSKILKNLIKSESFENASEFDAIIEIEVLVILKYEELRIY